MAPRDLHAETGALTVRGAEAPRILGLVEGDPNAALSGVAARLLAAIGDLLPVVGCLDYQPHGPLKLAMAAATFRPERARWRAAFHTSLLSNRILSATLDRRVRDFDGQFDLALQVHGWVARPPRPYALYVDQTRLMAEREWPSWLPLSPRARPRILDLERRMYVGAAHVLAMGRPAADSLIADYGVDKRRISVVGGGLMFDAMPPESPVVDEPTITFVGRDFERKGGEVLLEAFTLVRHEIPEATLHLVGVQRISPHPAVVCHGTVESREHVAQLYRRTRVFCMPSRYEPYGFAFAEAMAHGVPCVGTNVQSIPEILDHGCAGLIVPPGDPGALAEALVRVLRSDELARQLGAAGRAHVQHSLTWAAVARRAAPALIDAARRSP